MKSGLDAQHFEEVVSSFQIKLFADVCALFGRIGREFEVKPLVYGDMALHGMPFDLRVQIASNDLSVHIYTDGGDANGSKGSFRLEREDYPSLENLHDDFLLELEKLI